MIAWLTIAGPLKRSTERGLNVSESYWIYCTNCTFCFTFALIYGTICHRNFTCIITVTYNSHGNNFHKFLKLSTLKKSDIDPGFMYTSICISDSRLLNTQNYQVSSSANVGVLCRLVYYQTWELNSRNCFLIVQKYTAFSVWKTVITIFVWLHLRRL